MRISIVIPALDEAGNIGPLIEETYAVLSEDVIGEVIVVDDGSRDQTPVEVKRLIDSGGFPGLRCIRHGDRNGKSAALLTGVRAAKSTVIATMDGDGQNDPRDIARLLEKLAPQGSDGPALVGGVRVSRKSDGSRKIASKVANWLRDVVLRDDCPDTACGLKVCWRAPYLRLPYFTTNHRYLPALFLSYGHQVAYLPVNDRPRLVGISKYSNLGRALIGMYDLVGVNWLRRRTLIPRIVDDSAQADHVEGRGSVLQSDDRSS